MDDLSPPVGSRRVHISDFVAPCRIGVHAHEERAPQRVRISLILEVDEAATPIEDRLTNVVCYDQVLTRIRGLLAADGHVRLIETLAERIAQTCLQDARIRHVRVRVDKLDVYDDVASVGIEIERGRRPHS